MLRKFYYTMPPGFRFALRWLYYLPQDILKRNKKLMSPPRRLIYTGRGDFAKQGQEWFQFFTGPAGLLPGSVFLDIGSGIGRIALPLTTYLTGRYEGFDPIKIGVDWCQNNISVRYPHFRFRYVDLYNDLYNSAGSDARSFQFPYEDKCFDFICAISVFTHLLPAELENYFIQISRVGKPGCKIVCTFFILDAEHQKQMAATNTVFQFKHRIDDKHALMDRAVKAANVAYYEPYLMGLIDSYQFKNLHRIRGYWSGGEKTMDLAFQDILVLEKSQHHTNMRVP